jgi:hypothetical protein
MSDMGVQPAAAPPQAPGMSQMQRVTSTFSAPSKTFEDIKRGNRSWWMPFIIMAAVGYLFFAAVSFKVGMQQVVDNQTRLMSPKQQEQLEKAPPEQRAMSAKIGLYVTEGIFSAGPIFVLIVAAVVSLVLWGTINFVFGGKAKFGGIFAVWFFANLPSVIKTLLGTVVLFAGSTPETFNVKNYAPTNLGAFLNPAETNQALYALATSLDVITIWSLALMGMGIAIVAGVKRGSGYIAVFGWWIIIVLIGVGYAAATS